MTSGQTLKKRLLYFIPALVLAGLGVLTLIDRYIFVVRYGDQETFIFFLVAFFGIAFVFLLLGIMLVKHTELSIFDEGIIFTRGSKSEHVAFSDLEGINDTKTSTTVIVTSPAGGLVGGLIIGLLASFIPALNPHKIKLRKKDGTTIKLSKSFLHNFKEVAENLHSAYTEYLLKDLSKENLSDANISFGPQLQLRDGQLVYCKNIMKKSETIIPFENISNICGGADGVVWIDGPKNEKGKAETLAKLSVESLLNIDALDRIVQMAQNGG